MNGGRSLEPALRPGGIRVRRPVVLVVAVLLALLTAPGTEARLVVVLPGLECSVAPGWELVQRRPLAFSLVHGDRAVIDLYIQPLGDKSPQEYISYSAHYLRQPVGGIVLTGHRRAEVDGWYLVEEFRWHRPPVSSGDLNYYRKVSLARDDVVYTFLLRTAAEGWFDRTLDDMLASVRVLPLEPAGEELALPEVPPHPREMLAGRYVGERLLEIDLADEGVMWGVFHRAVPYDLYPVMLKERLLGTRFNLIMSYHDFTRPFQAEALAANMRNGRLSMVTWQPWRYMSLTDPIMIPLIAGGHYDEYVRQWARGVREYGQPLLIRFANEMNGDWDPWCAWFYGLDHSLFTRAWQRVHRLFQEEGATNAMWVWNPHDRSYPDFVWNDPHLYYPGDEYVDWVGLTGYNTGPRAGDPWRSFDEIYASVYREYLSLYPGKPMLITEFSSDEEGGCKAAWIRETFASLPNYPAIRLVVWFDAPWWEWDYAIDSSPEAFEAFRQGMEDPFHRGGTVRYRGDGAARSGAP